MSTRTAVVIGDLQVGVTSLVLRANGVDSVVVAGVATSAMVAATVYSAADHDYAVHVAREVCADPDASAHDAFLTSIFPSRGVAVATNAELHR